MIILVVEDEAFLALALEDTLTDAGYQVLGPAPSVERALRLADGTRPDLALVNIKLRDGGDGTQLARELRARHGTPSLFVSGQLRQAQANRDAALGYIEKPYTPDMVLKSIGVVRLLLAGRPAPEVPSGLILFASDDGPSDRPGEDEAP